MRVYIPKTIDETTKILGELRDDAYILAGGTDLIVRMKERTVVPENIININKLSLDYIKEERNQLRIGALTTLETLFSSRIINIYAPVLSDAAGKMGSPQIRNLGTIGGNIANASPAADTVPPLFVLNACITLKGKRGERAVAIGEFFTGPGENIMERDEFITEVVFKKMESDEVWFFKKLGQRKALTIAKISLAFGGRLSGRKLNEVSIALGAVASTVIYAKRIADFLNSKRLTCDVIDEVSKIIQKEIEPITDIRSTVEYRRKMAGALLKQGLLDIMYSVIARQS